MSVVVRARFGHAPARMRIVSSFCFVLLALMTSQCDALEESLQGQAAPLKEPDLPNCSRVLTCCANLDRQTIVPVTIKDTCHGIATPTDAIIVEYQDSRHTIEANTTTSPETKAELIAELRTRTQQTMEPACRCLLEETVGNLSLGGILSPADCETVVTSGQLPAGQQCDDVTTVITSPQ